MSKPLIVLTLQGASPEEIVSSARSSGFLPHREPDASVAASGKAMRIRGDGWLKRLTRVQGERAVWGDAEDADAFCSHRQGTTTLAAKLSPVEDRVLACLQDVRFTIAVISPLYDEWYEPPLDYYPPTFADGFSPHGWACAFRGSGHDRLVSRRWLEHGPWHLHQRPGDLSIVEFHDGAADASTALQQARAGHARMGISDTGGYIQTSFVYKVPPRGFYDADTHLLKVVVHGREPSERELLEACALRIETRKIEPGPVSNVAYVFMEEHEARAHLHELWLRGLECRTIVNEQEVRLDEDYAPATNPPSWVRFV